MTGDRGDDDLSAADAHILALESSSVMGHTLKLNVLSPGPPVDLDALRDAVNARLPSQPRARMRVDTTGAVARWVPANSFDISDHVRRSPVTAGDASADQWQVVSRLMSEHLDRDRPLWSIDVVGPLADGSEAIAVRMHHAMVDGIAGVRFLESVLWDIAPSAETAPGSAPPAPKVAGDAPGPGAGAPHRDRWFTQARRVPGAVFRELGHPGGRSPFDVPITGDRELAFTALPLAQIRAIGSSRPVRATVNDVLLAVLAGALRDWLPRQRTNGGPGAGHHLHAQVPVSLHRAGEGNALGNLDSFFNVGLPLGEPDPVVRLDRIRAQTARRKRAGDARELYDVVHATSGFEHLGPAVQRMVDSPRQFGVSISNVPGPRRPVSVLGRPLRHLFSSSEPAPHHALRVAAISCVGEPLSGQGGRAEPQLGIGLCTDPGALTGLPDLATSIERSHDELLSATG